MAASTVATGSDAYHVGELGGPLGEPAGLELGQHGYRVEEVAESVMMV